MPWGLSLREAVGEVLSGPGDRVGSGGMKDARPAEPHLGTRPCAVLTKMLFGQRLDTLLSFQRSYGLSEELGSSSIPGLQDTLCHSPLLRSISGQYPACLYSPTTPHTDIRQCSRLSEVSLCCWAGLASLARLEPGDLWLHPGPVDRQLCCRAGSLGLCHSPFEPEGEVIVHTPLNSRSLGSSWEVMAGERDGRADR